MSVERAQRKGSVVWRARWRDGGGARSRVFSTKRDAQDFDAEVTRMKRLGTLASLDAGQVSLADFAPEWWALHVKPNLARATQVAYAGSFDAHILPRLGPLELRQISPRVVARFRADLESSGVGPAATRKALVVLQAILAYAVLWGHIPVNPATAVQKPSGKRARDVVAHPPAVIEDIRRHFTSRGDQLSATLVSVLAYGGLRPQEALALRWEDVRARTLLIDKAVADGVLTRTKTGRNRTVTLLAPLASDLARWRLASKWSGDDDLVFPRDDGRAWRDHDWRNWRARSFAPGAAAAGITRSRPYDLRHAFCSLLIHEGQTVPEVAKQAGHAPTMTLTTYAHVIDEATLRPRVSAEDAIRAARETTCVRNVSADGAVS